MQKGSAGATAGGKCRVTEGSNKGKEGTYTIDDEDGSTWCEGDWGGTQCSGTKCEDVESRAPVFDSGTVYETDGLYVSEGKVYRVRAAIDATSGEARQLAAIPVSFTTPGALPKSASDAERMLSAAIETSLKRRTAN